MQEIEAKQTNEINWDDLLPRLILYSLRLIRSYQLEDRVSAEDVALRALERGIRYEREGRDIQNFSSFVMHVAKNIVVDAKRKETIREKHVKEVSLEEVSPEDMRQEEKVTRELEHKELLDALLQTVTDDAKLAEFVGLLVQDPYLQSRELSEKMRVPISEVYRLKKRLQKRLIDRVTPNLEWKNNLIEKGRSSEEQRLES